MAIDYRVIDLTQRESFNRVGWFFRRESSCDCLTTMLFDTDRLRRCDEAAIAEEDGEIVGVATLASTGTATIRLPTLDTLYVTTRHRKCGLGYALFKNGVQRLSGRSSNGLVFCDFHNRYMPRLAAKLPAQLLACLRVHESFHDGDLADDFEILESWSSECEADTISGDIVGPDLDPENPA